MEELIGGLLGIFLFVAPPIILLGLGLFVGRAIERNHFVDLSRREQATSHVLATQVRSYHQPASSASSPSILVSEVVISSDYLKSFLGNIQNLFGGEIRSFETLLERARREGILRLKEQAIALGYDAICCVRIETAEIGGHDPARKKAIVMASLLLSATAYHRGSSTSSGPIGLLPDTHPPVD